MAAFLQHTVLFFWNRYEVPELARQRQRQPGHGVNSRSQEAHISPPQIPMFDSLGPYSADAAPQTAANQRVPSGMPAARAVSPASAQRNGPPSVGEQNEGGVNRREERPSSLTRGGGLSGLGSIYASLLSGSSDDLAALAERRSSGNFSSDGSRRESEDGARLPAGMNGSVNGVSSGLPWVLGGGQGSFVSWLPAFREVQAGQEAGVQRSESRREVEVGPAPEALSRVVEEPSREGLLLSPTDANASNDWGVRRRDHHRGRRWRSWEED